MQTYVACDVTLRCERDMGKPAFAPTVSETLPAITIIGDDPRVDLLTLAWSVRYVDAAPKARRVELEGVEIPFADLDTLIRTKQTDRFQDKADVENLEAVKRLEQSR
jgi:hypothetical protein